ncbi:MAG: sugar transferase, partial [Ginsengibacter sp.]
MKVESSINKQLNLPDLNELGSLVVHNELLPSGKYLLKFIPAIRHSGIVPFERLPLNLKHNLYIKRVGDIIVSMLIILCVLSWLIPLLALIIKLDSKGPVFFFQKRNNRNGKVFT